jgi:hypothetical protein
VFSCRYARAWAAAVCGGMIAQGQGLGLLVKAQARPRPNLIELRYDGALPSLPVYLVPQGAAPRARHSLIVMAVAEALRKALV